MAVNNEDQNILEVNPISYDFDNYDTIIVYGAGMLGSNFLIYMIKEGVKKEKVIFWDMNSESIREICGFKISNPNFDMPLERNRTLVVIALHNAVNAIAYEEVKKKFIASNYKNIVYAEDIMRRTNNLYFIPASEFSDKSHENTTYQEDMDFSEYDSIVKPIAFYLPQFHEIPENSKWWGEGFTEWTNTKKAKPNFNGHYQPREPHDSIGYYDLSDVETIRKQAEMAKRHGVYGWGIYYYWFSGKTLLTKPIDIILENKDIDINYFLCWANEDWSKSWVGDRGTTLIDNDYSTDDPFKFIDSLKKYIDDERYMRINGKPIIMIYRNHIVPNIKIVVHKWRDRAREIGIGEIMVMSTTNVLTNEELGFSEIFDGQTDFCPAFRTSRSGRGDQLVDKDNNIVSNFMFYYDDFVKEYKRIIKNDEHDAYRSCVCGFDNSPRYAPEKASMLNLDFSLKSFYDLVSFITNDAKEKKKEFFFIFAWNEWAESAYLEPDKKFGYALINTFSKALFGLPLE